MPLADRLLHILNKVYSSDSEDMFLHTATHLILEATAHSPDYNRNIFDHPLTECFFRVSLFLFLINIDLSCHSEI